MNMENLFYPRGDVKRTPLARWLQRALFHMRGRHLSMPGHCDAGLCRLSSLPSCCFTHVADKQK